MENRLWRSLGCGITAEQRVRLEGLLTVPEGSRASGLERLRLGPVTVSGPALALAARDRDALKEVEAEVKSSGADPLKVALDLRGRESAEILVKKTLT